MHKTNKNQKNHRQTCVPLDSLVTLEKAAESAATKPSIAVGKVGKWGVTSFTSIRTAYRVGIQPQPTPQRSTDAAVHGDSAEDSDQQKTEQPAAPRPRKFFKSRATTAPPPPPIVAQHVADEFTTNSSSSKHHQISISNKKEKKAKKQKKPEIAPERPATRVSSRAKSRINYNEDDSASVSSAALPAITSTTTIQEQVAVVCSPPQAVQQQKSPAIEPEAQKPTNSEPVVEHPKIVLRISKKTLKVVDSNNVEKVEKPTTTTEEEKIQKSPSPPPSLPSPSEPEERPRLIKRLCIRKPVVEDLAVAPEFPEPIKEIVEKPVKKQSTGRSTRKKVEEIPEPIKESAPTRSLRGKKAETPMVEEVIKETPPVRSLRKKAENNTVEPSPPPEPVRAVRKRGRPARGEAAKEIEENIEPSSPPVTLPPPTLPAPKSTPTKSTPEKRQTTPRKGKNNSTTESSTVVAVIEKSPPSSPSGTRRSSRNKIMQDKNTEVQTQAASKTTTLQTTTADGAVTKSPRPVEQPAEKPSVKLVISKKKGSIFKSRALVNDAGNKRHVYKHKWDDEDEEGGKETTLEQQKVEKKMTETKTDTMDFDFDEPIKKPDEARTSTKENSKRLAPYTFVRNVKKAHQMQEIGEFQELDDDVEYILSALQPDNPIATRCLSALQLASKCITPAFRMHVRAHGIGTKFFKALQDAPNDPNLGLCTATVLFVLSQDTLNIDLDRDSLELMLNLLDVSKEKKVSGQSQTQLQKNRKKVKELCAEIKALGKATHLNLENINVGTLAMETLLSLTSKRAGEWFKEELRTLGGLDHIMKTVCDCCQEISDYVAQWSEDLLDKLRKIERCLRVLENVTQQNQENQTHVLKYNRGDAINTLVKFYKLCDTEISLYPTNDSTPKDNPGCIIREALTPTLKVLINLTHPFNPDAEGSVVVGRITGVFDTSLHLLLQSPNYVPESCVFDISILVLLLLINLTTFTESNRSAIMQAHAPTDFGSQFAKVSAIKALVKFFYKCEELASLAEKNTDAILDTPAEKATKTKSQEEVEETVTKLLQKAGHHMEHTMLASYVSILIGHLIIDNESYKTTITKYLRNNSFDTFANILEKYYNFMSLTTSSEASQVEHVKSTKKILDYLKELD